MFYCCIPPPPEKRKNKYVVQVKADAGVHKEFHLRLFQKIPPGLNLMRESLQISLWRTNAQCRCCHKVRRPYDWHSSTYISLILHTVSATLTIFQECRPTASSGFHCPARKKMWPLGGRSTPLLVPHHSHPASRISTGSLHMLLPLPRTLFQPVVTWLTWAELSDLTSFLQPSHY